MLAEGSTIAGRYRLASLIGEGGMASVWRAEDETLKRSVAIKLLYFGVHRDAQARVDHFLREARLAASIQHRNVINIVDFGSTELGVPYMVMELLEGESLAARLDRPPRLEMDELVRFASLILRGLAAVHDAGIVHRDLKPQNVFLQRDAEGLYPKILDFGISRSLAASAERPSAIATQEGLVMGTPHYMAPEQARGEADIDKRADIYAMGAIIYEGITGRLPFDANTTGELLVKIISTQARPMRELRPDVPEVLSDCVAQAMAPNREHRFVDAKVFRRALQSAADSAFPPRTLVRGSEQPRVARGAQLGAAVAVQVAFPEHAPLAAASALADGLVPAPALAPVPAPPPAVEQPAPLPKAAPANQQLGAWGDFEGLDQSSERISKPRMAAVEPGSATAPAAARAQPNPTPAARAQPNVAAAAPARAQQAQAPEAGANTHEGAMLGESPLDGFGSGEGPTRLDLDYGPGDAPRGSRQSPLPKAAGKRASVAGRSSQDARRIGLVGRRARPSALWIVPAVLLLVVFVFLLAPGTFSAASVDDAAAREREAQSPATRDSDRHLQRDRPGNLAKLPPALRELAE